MYSGGPAPEELPAHYVCDRGRRSAERPELPRKRRMRAVARNAPECNYCRHRRPEALRRAKEEGCLQSWTPTPARNSYDAMFGSGGEFGECAALRRLQVPAELARAEFRVLTSAARRENREVPRRGGATPEVGQT